MAGPLSITDLLEKQRKEKEEAAKPKFLTKAERAALALEKRQKEIEEQKAVGDRARMEREALDRKLDEERRAAYNAPAQQYGGSLQASYNPGGPNVRGGRGRGAHGGGRGGRGGYNDGNGRGGYHDGHSQRGGPSYHQGGPPPNGQYDRGHAPHNGYDQSRQPSSGFMGPPSINGSRSGAAPYGSSVAPPEGPRSGPGLPPTSGSSADVVPEYDIDAIKARYLGQEAANKKRKLRKTNDKKFVFDWEAEDDTAASVHAGALMIGNGVMLGGSRAGLGGGRGVEEGEHDPSTGKRKEDQYADELERRSAKKSGGDDRHWTEKKLEEMRDRDWRIFREDFSIAARGGSIPLPLRNWEESTIPAGILSVIKEVGYTEPSAIQRQAIPIGMQNRDLIGIAETGSGKTAAFVIPLLTYIGNLPPLTDENRHQGPYALILAPTRELAQQIESETRKFATPLGYTCVSIVGGRSIDEQQYNLRDGAEIIIATPGRLKDILDRHMLVLSQCAYIVMDEADRMVDLGFEEELTFILDKLPVAEEGKVLQPGDDGWRITTLFSATMPPAVERISKKYLRKPAVVTIGIAGQAVDTVEQRVEFISGDEKKKTRMIQILRTCGLKPPMIVFCNQKKTADMVAKDIQKAGFSATTLHSGKNQEQREEALQSLRDGRHDILVATDLAGRGIDVPDVSLVINWQMSATIEAYVHRIGRTGRAGKTGVAVTFLDHADEEVLYDLKSEIQKSERSKLDPELARHPAAQQRIAAADKYKRKRPKGENDD